MNRYRDQTPFRFVSWANILRNRAFAYGVTDQRRGKPFRQSYEQQTPEWQQLYEKGRQWAVLAGPRVKLRGTDGRLTHDAMQTTLTILPDIL
jgi:hypothetical protein